MGFKRLVQVYVGVVLCSLMCLKPLYRAKSLSELQRLCFDNFSTESFKDPTVQLHILLQNADKLRNIDEEESYISYTRALKLFNQLPLSASLKVFTYLLRYLD